MVHCKYFPNSYANPGSLNLSTDEKNYINGYLSAYPGKRAGSDNVTYIREVFAEMWAKIASGQSLDLKLQVIYGKIISLK